MSVASRDIQSAHASHASGGHDMRSASNPGQVPAMEQSRHHASPEEAWAEAFSQMHQQLAYHTSLFEAQRRDAERLDSFVERLRMGMGDIWSHLDALKADVAALKPAAPSKVDHGDVDILSEQLQKVAAKASELDGIKMQVDILTRRMRRLEGTGSPPPSTGPLNTIPAPTADQPSYQQRNSYIHAQQPAQHTVSSATSAPLSTESHTLSYPHPSDNRLPPPPMLKSTDSRTSTYDHPPSSSETCTLPSIRGMDAGPPTQSSWRSNTAYTPQQSSGMPTDSPSMPQSAAESQTATGWAAVNRTKRGYSNEERMHHDHSAAPGSPKRQRFATLMPRTNVGEHSGPTSQSSYHPPHSGTLDSGLPSLKPSTASSGELPPSAYTSSTSASAPASNNIRFVPFPSTQEADSQDSWRPESQRMPSDPARCRGGRGGRARGRGRKSVGGADRDHELAGQDWDRSSWTGTQAGPESYYKPTVPPAPLSAHSPPGVRPVVIPDSQQLPKNMSPVYAGESGWMSSETPLSGGMLSDQSKRSRTKPIRNADGILIRKDGRPDMRSVSSAMNLRKVHAKKQDGSNGEQRSDSRELADGTPTSATSHGEEGSAGTDRTDWTSNTPTHGDGREGGEEYGAGSPEYNKHAEHKKHALAYSSAEGRDDHRGYDPEHGVNGVDVKPEQHDGQRQALDDKHSAPIASMTSQVMNDNTGDSQMTDVALRDMADAQMTDSHGEHHREVDAKSEPVAARQA